MTDPKGAGHANSGSRREKDVLTLGLRKAATPEDFDRVYADVNGRDLIELARIAELESATDEGTPELAGSYDGLTTFEWKWIGELIEGKENDVRMADGSVVLLVCECGSAGCWPLCARVEIVGDAVDVSGFFQPFRKQWRHDGLGPFVFGREQVLREIQEVLDHG